MRNTERLRKLRDYLDEKLCEGRMMKCPADDFDITKIVRQRPRVYLGWQPARPDTTGLSEPDPINVCPGILVMPMTAHAKYVEEQHFDRYKNVHRPQEMGSGLNVQILFSVYEPGVRLPGFIDSGDDPDGLDMTLIKEGTEEGLFTLMNWMDDCTTALLADKFIPGTDLFLIEADLNYGLYSDQSFVVDKRPIYYGIVQAYFNGYSEDKDTPQIDKYLI